MTQKTVRRLVVIGLGLIGGSLAKAAKARSVCERVIGLAVNQEIVQRAVDLGVVDEATTDLQALASTLGEGDVIFIAVPTLSVKSVLKQIEQWVSSDVTITDGASVKGSVFRDVREVYGCIPPQVVLGHPIAGSEKSGVEAANPDLYVKHRIILTPTSETASIHLQRVANLWQAVEAEVQQMGVEDHDEILGATSHLPHAIAFSLVDTLAHDSKNENIFRYAAGGFRDFTRIASSDAVMWRDIMLANDQAVIDAIDLFTQNLSRMREAISQKDGQALLGVFTRAKAARDHFSAMLERRAYISGTAVENAVMHLQPATQLAGEVFLPGDKSISHRAIILASLATGISKISGFNESEDALASVQAFRDMGVVIEGPEDGLVRVHGVGLRGLQAPAGPIYVGQAGTALKLLLGLLPAQNFDSEVIADEKLSAANLQSVIEPLQQLGARFALGDDFNPPVLIHGDRQLHAPEHTLSCVSAQVKASLLLAALYAEGETRVQEKTPTRDHSERLMAAFGAKVRREASWLAVEGGGSLAPCDIHIPGDFTVAVGLIVAASIAQSADVHLKCVGLNPSRTAALSTLSSFGCRYSVDMEHSAEVEPRGDIHISASVSLTGVSVSSQEVVGARDELPALMMLASVAQGETKFHGINALPVSHQDRVTRMIQNLRTLGVQCEFNGEILMVAGDATRLFNSAGNALELDADNDPRIALALLPVVLRSSKPVTILNASGVQASFYRLVTMAKRLGISLEII